MKLSQLFSGEVRADSTASHSSQLTPAQMEQANRQIRSLVPGQTISGEIISRNGSDVQIRVSDDIILNARVDRNLNIEVGKNMTFEVKNNGSSLTLSPLFTNVATGVNVLKALDMAGLPVNRASIDMTEQLMAAGMPVNRNSLQQIFREIGSYPQAEISDIINLHKLQMPVNEANLNQMVSYRNLNHQLTQGMDAILEALPEVFDSMAKEGDTAGMVKLYQEVLRLVQNEGGMSPGGDVTGQITGQPGTQGVAGPVPGQAGTLDTAGQVPGQTISGDMETAAGDAANPGLGNLLTEDILSLAPGQGTSPGAEVVPGQGSLEGGTVLPGQGFSGEVPGLTGQETPGEAQFIGGLNPEAVQEGAVSERELSLSDILSGRANEMGESADNPLQALGAGASESIPENLRAAMARDALSLLDSMHMHPEQASALRGGIQQFARGEAGVQQFFSILDSLAEGAKFSSGAMKQLEKLFSSTRFRSLLSTQLKNNWMLRPEEMASPGKVAEMYNRLDRQLKLLGSALEHAGQSETVAYRAVSSMSQNLDFLQQVNQMYTYVQLPLRLQHRDAQGELYVYTNKKKLSSQDGTVSALLHLDMENLGPLDVYVALKESKVNTRFYLRDDDMIGFMAGHMDVLTQRLQKRGYDCSYSMTVRDEGKESEATKGGLEPVLRQNKGVMLSHYAFDVRT